MFDDIEDPDITQERLRYSADHTHRKTKMLSVLRTLHIRDQYMGSGVIVSITDMKGKAIIEPTLFSGENFNSDIFPRLADGLDLDLQYRASLLRSELAELEKVISDART